MDPVRVTTAADLVITKEVCRSLADGALSTFLDHLKTQPILEAELEVPVLKVETQGLGGDDIKLVSGMRKRGGVSWSLGLVVQGVGNEVIGGCQVDATGEKSLTEGMSPSLIEVHLGVSAASARADRDEDRCWESLGVYPRILETISLLWHGEAR